MIKYGLPWPLCLSLIFLLAASLTATAAKSTAEKPSPDQALAILKQGNVRFAAGAPLHPHSDAARLKQAGTENQGDHAYATVIACSDSRVPVEQIFDSGIMDIFVIRVAGNVCNVDEIGSIEYGIAHVHTPVVVVLGHTQCGAVTAVTETLQGAKHPLERNIPPLIAGIKPAVQTAMKKHPEESGKNLIPYAIEENVWKGIHDLFMASPVTRNFVKEGKVKVVGAVYDVSAGWVTWLPDTKVAAILKKVESDPKRAQNPMAEE